MQEIRSGLEGVLDRVDGERKWRSRVVVVVVLMMVVGDSADHRTDVMGRRNLYL